MSIHTSLAEHVLSVDDDSVASFITHQVRARTLSVLMRDLNHAFLGEDATASAMAADALRHLGFPINHRV